MILIKPNFLGMKEITNKNMAINPTVSTEKSISKYLLTIKIRKWEQFIKNVLKQGGNLIFDATFSFKIRSYKKF